MLNGGEVVRFPTVQNCTSEFRGCFVFEIPNLMVSFRAAGLRHVDPKPASLHLSGEIWIISLDVLEVMVELLAYRGFQQSPSQINAGNDEHISFQL